LTDDDIIHCPNLQTLVLYSDCEISENGIKSLLNLTDLQIYEKNLLTDEWIPHLTNLTKLQIDKNFLPEQATISNIRQTLTNLKNLNF
jgi:hypothetical protein